MFRSSSNSKTILHILLIGACLVFGAFEIQAQDVPTWKVKILAAGTDSLLLDERIVLSTSITFPEDFSSPYSFDPTTGYLHFNPPLTSATTVRYRTLEMKRDFSFANKDSSMIRPTGSANISPYVYQADLFPQSSFEQNGLVKAGSISRGVTFGNSQDLAVNSNLNLQLSGKITDRFQVLASITDDNIPIQPDGNTQQLQDFDQVYIQVFDDQSRITAGDFQIVERDHHFLRYQKRARGATAETTWGDSLNTFGLAGSAAVSKGKFARNIIQGVEGNQGPYRLIGEEGERFIIVLAGTERVFIDGRLLQRGQAADYVIDYNTSEVTFTPRNLITKDRRIVVEFQYSDRNYARSLIQGEAWGEQGKYSWFVHALSEQDSKNQPLQQDLDLDDRQFLGSVGDNLNEAVINSVDSLGFTDDQVLYAVRDSLGYDSVLVFTSSPDSAFYRAIFSSVGLGNGDYVEDGFTANGRIYKWIAPDTVDNVIIRNGDHAPLRLLVTPKQRQMITGGGKIQFSEDHQLTFEASFTQNDVNTFSDLDAGDNGGMAFWTDWSAKKKVGNEQKTKMGVRLFHEYVQQNFTEIERWRSVEFDRDWNIRGLELFSDQHVAGTALSIAEENLYSVSVEGAYFSSGSAYEGYRGSSLINYLKGDRKLNWQGSFTQSEGLVNSNFIRQKTNFQWPVGPVVLGYKDDFEWNRFSIDDTLTAAAYRFHEWQTFIGSQLERKLQWKIFYGQRTDKLPANNELLLSTEAQEYGVEGSLAGKNNRRLTWNARRRTLAVSDSTLSAIRPEETLLGRIDAGADLFKGLLGGQLFYETGSGLEQARQFIYIEVPAGQGTYVWVDYNEDGVKDLNEFEIAAFAYEANYIRTFVPSDDYVRTYTNQFSLSTQLQPARIWSNEKGFKKTLAKFSNVFSIRLDRKTTRDKGLDRLNPLETQLADTSLLSLGSVLRNTFSFNRTNPNFGVEYTYQDLGNKTLLANGFESRSDEYHEVRVRKKVVNGVTAIVINQVGTKTASSDFLTGRNYSIDYLSLEPELQWQPSTSFRLTLKGRYESKLNDGDFGGEKATISDIGTELRFSDPGKGIFSLEFHYLDIAYNGSGNNALSFEMLESLNVGRNAIWTAGVQRSISRNLQLSLLYNGRTSELGTVIHAGSVQIRATF